MKAFAGDLETHVLDKDRDSLLAVIIVAPSARSARLMIPVGRGFQWLACYCPTSPCARGPCNVPLLCCPAGQKHMPTGLCSLTQVSRKIRNVDRRQKKVSTTYDDTTRST